MAEQVLGTSLPIDTIDFVALRFVLTIIIDDIAHGLGCDREDYRRSVLERISAAVEAIDLTRDQEDMRTVLLESVTSIVAG